MSPDIVAMITTRTMKTAVFFKPMMLRRTRMLGNDKAGPASAQRLLTLVYGQLRKIAQQRMSEERAGHTLQATALCGLVSRFELAMCGDLN